jgi:hypothetical protein
MLACFGGLWFYRGTVHGIVDGNLPFFLFGFWNGAFMPFLCAFFSLRIPQTEIKIFTFTFTGTQPASQPVSQHNYLFCM